MLQKYELQREFLGGDIKNTFLLNVGLREETMPYLNGP